MRRLLLGLFVVCAGSVAACSSAPRSARGPAPEAPEAPAAPEAVPRRGSRVSSPREEVAGRLIRTARSLLATPYRYGGADSRGFDCSGLTVFVFGREGVDLPRTAESQASAGRWVAPDELSEGDLVFFGESRAKPFHVGLVVSVPGEPLTMIHSSSSRGVIQTEVTASSYWLSRLKFGRRVLD